MLYLYLKLSDHNMSPDHFRLNLITGKEGESVALLQAEDMISSTVALEVMETQSGS